MSQPGGIVITLSWPAKELSPNAREHWATISRAKKAAREEAYWATKCTIGRRRIDHDGASDIILKQTAHPPDKRALDRDNLDSKLKAHRDGIAQALGIDDKFFRPTGIEWGEVISGGKIVIEVAA